MTPSTAQQRDNGRQLRRTIPRAALADLNPAGRDPLAIIGEQNSGRLPELVPLRMERMAASPFTFLRGTAAIMAADLAAAPHTGLLVAACGDAHVSNFGLYATPQRTLAFDLNDFDEAAWAPWEWDLKRLIASVVVAGQATARAEAVIRDAALATVRRYAARMDSAARRSPLARYFDHFDPRATAKQLDPSSRRALKEAMRGARRRTGERAARRLLETGADGQRRFAQQPPVMTRLAPEVEQRMRDFLADYAANTTPDIRQLLDHYTIVDLIRRAVGVGSVGTRCNLALLEDADGQPLILQAKQAGPSVLAHYGGIQQPDSLVAGIAEHGEGWRVVALQRVLQAYSDPFLGHLRVELGDFYVRQFHDQKGGFEVEELDDTAFHRYALACAAVLARAHSQSPAAATIAGYLGTGRAAAEAILTWSLAYADLARTDWTAFTAAQQPPA